MLGLLIVRMSVSAQACSTVHCCCGDDRSHAACKVSDSRPCNLAEQ
jgi:hypothetical protein